MLEVVGSWCHLTLTFKLESYFRILLIQAIPIPSNFIFGVEIVSEYLGHSSVSRPGLDRDISYDNAQSNTELLTF